MTNDEIRDIINTNNHIIEQTITPNMFTLNNTVAELLAENKRLQDLCTHEFKGGYCIYCYKSEEE